MDREGRLHFAPDLVDQVRRTAGQELGSHTFSHVYLREPGFERSDAVADTNAMAKLFRDRWQTQPVSFVFPRNQVGHVDVLREGGIRFWRETSEPFYWRATAAVEQSKIARVLRFADAFLALGRRVAPTKSQRASYFVRFGLPRTLWRAQCRRIREDARKLREGETLHLWWHPHNLGDAPAMKVARAGELLDTLRDAAPTATRFKSMGDVANENEAAS
jgi:hypothetical protein